MSSANSPPSVLIFRPQPEAEATAQRARDRGITPILYPLFTVSPLPWDAPVADDYDAIMLTSANTLRHGGDGLSLFHHLPAFAVGDATARAATSHGFASVTTAGPDAVALLKAIGATPHRRLFHPGGRDFKAYDHGQFTITRRAVYHAAETGDKAGLARCLMEKPLLLVHSPRAGHRVAELIPVADRSGISLIALSPAVQSAAGQGWQRSMAPDAPNDSLMLDIAQQICQI